MSSIARFINGVISACIVVFFLVHASMGTLSVFFDFESSLSWTVWIGVVAVVAHILVSVVTSIQQLNDKKYPPSTRKKLHLLLKWVTGVLLAVAAIVHIVCIALYDGASFQVTASGMMVTVALLVVLAVHVWVGSKSLLTDLHLDGRNKGMVRLVVCVVVAILVIAAVVGAKM